MKALFLAAAAVAALLSPAAKAQSLQVSALIAKVDALDDRCRGGSGDNPATMAACDSRERVMAQLKQEGWCWGPSNAIGADKRWVPCTTPVNAGSTWFGADINKTTCFPVNSPADRIRMIQSAGSRARVNDLAGGTIVEVGEDIGGGNVQYWTYYRSVSACLSNLPRLQKISAKYE